MSGKAIVITTLALILTAQVGGCRLTRYEEYVGTPVAALDGRLKPEALPEEVFGWFPPLAIVGGRYHLLLTLTLEASTQTKSFVFSEGTMRSISGAETALIPHSSTSAIKFPDATAFSVSPLAFADWRPSEEAYTINAIVKSCQDLDELVCRSETVEMSLSRQVRWQLSNFWWDVLSGV